MSYLITIIVFLIVFSLLVLVHEFGHFYMAKKAGIKVEEFGFGLPPRVWGKKKGETIYSINAIPFGGFVRMYGEDSRDSKFLRSKRSFIAQPLRARMMVVVAGVIMNFLLAWLLLFIGFSVGMQPLLGPDDVFTAIKNDQIVLEGGLTIKEIKEDSLAFNYGIQEQDSVYSFNDQLLNDYVVADFLENPVGNYQILRNGDILDLEFTQAELDEGLELGLEFYDYVSFPRVKIYDLENYSNAYKAGIRPGDYILSVNGVEVFAISEFEDLLNENHHLDFMIFRDGFTEEFIIENKNLRKVVLSNVIPGQPADLAGLQQGDVVVSVNSKKIHDSLELIEYVDQNPDSTLVYMVKRDGQNIRYEITPEDGKIGVYLSELFDYSEQDGFSLYNTTLLSSVIEIKEEQYPWYQSIGKSFSESWRLAKLTGRMFVGLVSNLFTDGEVPDTVAGPVGIAQMTHTFVQEGFIPLIRFVAILSLSLAVINILPFPALDGGRLLFLIVEMITGRRVNQKWEAHIHALGYLLILLLIVVVTYSDILRLFSS